MAALGAVLLVVPTGGCGAVVAAWVRSPAAVPADPAPQLDDAELRRDAQAVSAAQAALAAWRPAPVRAVPTSTGPTSRTRTVPAVDPQEVAAVQRRGDAAQDDVDADQDELDRLLAEQEASSDPASYDGEVAAAREQLEQSVAELEEAQRDLAAAKARTRTVTSTVSPSSRPGPVPTSAGADRATLAAALADARAQQAAHLAARQRAVADWRSAHQADVSRVVAHNARVRACASRAAVPGVAGLCCLLLAAVLAGAHIVRGRLTH